MHTMYVWIHTYNFADQNGFISKEEMLKVITKCNHLSGDSEKEALKCLKEIDVDGDGKVSFPEFLLTWKFKNWGHIY